MPLAWLKRRAITLVVLAAFGVAAAALVALLPVWPLELAEHFRVQYLVVGLLVVIAAAALRLRGWFDAAAIATLVHLSFVFPDLAQRQRPVPDGTRVRILLLNVHTSSTTYAAVSKLITDTNADIVALVEVDQKWLDGLAPTVARYSSRIEHPQTDNFGVALFARGSLHASIEYLGLYPTIVGTVDIGGTPLAIVLAHPIPPVGRELDDLHATALAEVGRRARELGPRTVVLGDFNATPWSRPFRTLIASTGLCDTRAGFGLQASFPAASSIVRIPLDHMLVSCSIGVRDRWIARDVGSDHLPVVADLVVPP